MKTCQWVPNGLPAQVPCGEKAVYRVESGLLKDEYACLDHTPATTARMGRITGEGTRVLHV